MKFFGHPIHTILVGFPVGLLSTSVVFDLIAVVSNNEFFSQIAFYMLLSGLLTGLLASLFGLMDWLGIKRGTRAKSIGIWHALGNLLVLALFAGSAFLRWQGGELLLPTVNSAIYLSFAGAAVLGLTAWLGGELVYRLGIGVDPAILSKSHE